MRSGTISSRAAMSRTGAGASTSSSGTGTIGADNDVRGEASAIIEELKDRLKDTELKSEQFHRQAEVLQSRLDDALKEQGKLEDRLHESEEKLEILEYEKRDAARSKREMESIYEAERSSMNREREEMANREEELQTIIARMKDNLSQRGNDNIEERRLSRPCRDALFGCTCLLTTDVFLANSTLSSPSLDGGHFAPPSSINRSDSQNNSKLVLQKDKLIESLRLELAEAQIKMVETENIGGGRLNELEKLLLETRMSNARLMEDNESFQLLLSEKTLRGSFGFGGSTEDALNALEGRASQSSLADELSDAGEGDSTNSRRLEAELKTQKDQNKALTLYINKIIERLLQHQDFEAILDQSSDIRSVGNKDKDLPAPPTEGVLARARNAFSGSSAATAKAKPRPMSQMPAAHSALTDPETAPSIPFGLNRNTSTRRVRPQSEQFTGAATGVNQMYKGGPASPGTTGPSSPRNSNSFFTPPAQGGNPNAAARHPSAASVPTMSSISQGTRSDTSSIDSGDKDSISGNSPPREKPEKRTFAGGKPKPLSLVAMKEDEDKKKNNRASWMGWAASYVSKDGGTTQVEVIKE